MPAIDTGSISLFYREAGSAGQPVLLLHELGGSAASWSSVMPLMAPRRRVVAVDLRGAGLSEKPPGPFGLEQLADDLAAFLSALGIVQVDVVGGALGSLVGALLTLRHPSRVRRLMMAAVAADMAGRTADYLAQRAEWVRRSGMRAAVDASLANAFPEAHAAARLSYRAIYLGNDPNAYAEMSLALARMPKLDWATIGVPTLVASGNHDFIWPPDLGRAVAQCIPGARFSELADAGHFPHLQTPKVLVDIALAFFDATDPLPA
jgi:3-oxoadipate enol-lactonase